MKTNFITSFLGIGLWVALLCSCSKKQDSTDPGGSNNNATTFISGTWAITSYQQKAEDKTNQFSDYTFTFIASSTNAGTFTAVKDNNTTTGSWSHQTAVSYYGSTSSESFTLNIPSDPALEKISQLWNVTASTSTKLTLENPEQSEQEQLVFSKK